MFIKRFCLNRLSRFFNAVIKMQGRIKIKTDVQEITYDNCIDVLRKALSSHYVNAARIQFLLDYEEGEQPLLREKHYRTDIDCQIVDNTANEITEFKVGFHYGNPITFKKRNIVQGKIDAVQEFNDQYILTDSNSANQELARFFEIGGIGSVLTEDEEKLVKNYRTLDEVSKNNLVAISETLSEQSRINMLKNSIESMSLISDYSRLAAASTGSEWEDYPDEEKVLLLNNYAVTQADEIITVSGESMEPQFHDGDRVLVKYCSEVRIGDIGIFFASGYGALIKQVSHDRLHSLNPEFDDVYPYEEGAKVIGKVLCKVTEDMIPTPEQVKLYNEAIEELEI